ncbi:hypothetical protein JTE90_003338 [Oedothorax gibbosus]|uniref:Uncharacterized protein n=1 Tax=Oedothorax gibbosus TaxID=931172 RepID=A0AAV6UFU5_9ARAC|nr:hypothetical protein JTE90_003338 [Oedothorax gibbosus]
MSSPSTPSMASSLLAPDTSKPIPKGRLRTRVNLLEKALKSVVDDAIGQMVKREDEIEKINGAKLDAFRQQMLEIEKEKLSVTKQCFEMLKSLQKK